MTTWRFLWERRIRRTLLDLNAPQRDVAAILVDCLVEPIQEALYHLGAIDLVQDLAAAPRVPRQRRVYPRGKITVDQAIEIANVGDQGITFPCQDIQRKSFPDAAK